jgi:hypothetical protein
MIYMHLLTWVGFGLLGYVPTTLYIVTLAIVKSMHNICVTNPRLRINNKYGKDPTKQLRLRRRGFQSSPAHHWSEFFLEITHQFHTTILLSNWILTNQQTSIWILGSDAYFEYTSCYFKIVTTFVRNLLRVRVSYLLLIRRS